MENFDNDLFLSGSRKMMESSNKDDRRGEIVAEGSRQSTEKQDWEPLEVPLQGLRSPPPPMNLFSWSQFIGCDSSSVTTEDKFNGPYTGHSIQAIKRRVPTLKSRMLLASPGLLSIVVWTTMLIYMQAWFLNIERRPDGSFPRIGYSYAGYPFISCIGKEMPWVFRGTCIAVAACTVWVFTWDFIIGMRARSSACLRGRQGQLFTIMRCLKVFAAYTSAAFLIALSQVNDHTETGKSAHLIFTTVQILGTGGTRLFDQIMLRELHMRLEIDRGTTPRSMSRNSPWKKAEATIATICGIVMLPGMYGCAFRVTVLSFDPKETSMSGFCYGWLSYGGVAEWVLSVSWIFYMMSTWWDLVYVWEWNEIVKDVPADWAMREIKTHAGLWQKFVNFFDE